MTGSISLNETELLLLQRQMEGDVSGLNYTLQTTDVKRASYTGTEGGNIHQSPPVRETDSIGTIDTIKFRIEYHGEQLEPDRMVLLTIYNDGKINCQTPVKPSLVDAITSEIHNIKQYDEFLTPVPSLLKEFIDEKYAGRPTRDKESYEHKVQSAFTELIHHYFDTNHWGTTEVRFHCAIIANIGIALCEKSVPPIDDYTDVVPHSSGSLPIEGNTYIRSFFEDYARRKFEERDLHYEGLVSHLNYVLEKNWDRPLNILTEITEKYDIK